MRDAVAATCRRCARKVNEVNESMANIHSPSDAATDRQPYGHDDGASTCNRVTLFCNAYDKVTSSL